MIPSWQEDWILLCISRLLKDSYYCSLKSAIARNFQVSAAKKSGGGLGEGNNPRSGEMTSIVLCPPLETLWVGGGGGGLTQHRLRLVELLLNWWLSLGFDNYFNYYLITLLECFDFWFLKFSIFVFTHKQTHRHCITLWSDYKLIMKPAGIPRRGSDTHYVSKFLFCWNDCTLSSRGMYKNRWKCKPSGL